MKVATAAEMSRISDWQTWLQFIFPTYVTAPFAQRHREFWEWVESITQHNTVRPLIAVWPRGGAKSTSAELAVVRLGSKKARGYAWYVSGTQEQADRHVESVGAMLTTPRLAAYYPALARRAISKYGNAKAWRRNRLWTASGLTVDALGLDTSYRGAKAEERRPDLIVLDDVDENYDSTQAIFKKIDKLTKDVLPAGSSNVAILFIQNLIHQESIAARLVDKRADFLLDRELSGPFPALEGLEYQQVRGKFIITAGVPTWDGQDVEVCQRQMNLWGLTAFLSEAQHDVEHKGGKWQHIEFMHVKRSDMPRLKTVVVWVDPAISSTDKSDNQGIQADAMGIDDIIYRLYSWEGVDTPENTLERAIRKAIELGAGHVGVETDQGGDAWRSVFKVARDKVLKELTKGGRRAPPMPAFVADKAGSGYGPKDERNSRMMTAYETGQMVHVEGTHITLEHSLRRWPGDPKDLADAAFWSWNDLSGKGKYNSQVRAWGTGEQ